MSLKLGKKPARPDSIKLKFSLLTQQLPEPPAVFGHQALMVDGNWFMLGNDRAGDCVWAGACHEHMLWTLEGSSPDRAHFTTRDAFSDYSACTGFDPLKPNTDQGTDVQQACAYRQKTGIVDIDGVRHKIDAYASLDGDLEQLAQAIWIFGAVGVGVQFPANAEDQFNQSRPWSVVPGTKIVGGHYVPAVCRLPNGNFGVITWGRLQEVTPDWLTTYMDEAVCYLSREVINNSTKVSPENFNLELLNSYIGQI